MGWWLPVECCWLQYTGGRVSHDDLDALKDSDVTSVPM